MAIPNGFNLELVQVLFRHGARTCQLMETAIVKPEQIDSSFHNIFGYDQLSNLGKTQTYEFGCALRDRYDAFLGKIYRPEDVYALSTDYDRTKMSLQLVLGGLYPPAAQQIWNPELKWMPIPYDVAKEQDIYLQPYAYEKYHDALVESSNTLAFQEKLLKMHKSIEYLYEKDVIVNKTYSPVVTGFGLHNILHIHKTHKLKLPSWCTPNLFDMVRDVAIGFLDIMSITTEAKKFNGGVVINNFLCQLDVTNEKANKKKICLYATHEFTIGAFLRAHNIKNLEYPDFSNGVIFEKLRDSKNKVYVRMLGWNGKEFTTLKLGNYDDLCPVDEYIKLVKDVTPSDDEITSTYALKESVDFRFLNIYYPK